VRSDWGEVRSEKPALSISTSAIQANEARSTGGDPIVGIAGVDGDVGASLRISPLNLRGNVYLSFPARLAAGLCGWRATFANERVL
jgi:hypothetical protein